MSLETTNHVQSESASAKRGEMLVELGLSPIVAAAATAREFSSLAGKGADLKAFVARVSEAVDAAVTGGLRLTEVTLGAQAIALDVIFNECAQRAASAASSDLTSAEALLRLALKAQSQCRTTLLTLAEIKNPRPIAFVNQANFARGAQHVNNGPNASEAALDAAEKNSDEVVELNAEAGNPAGNARTPDGYELVKRKNGWTEERRERQAQITRAQMPWLNATGPKTDLGKAISASNGRKHFTSGRLGNYLPKSD